MSRIRAEGLRWVPSRPARPTGRLRLRPRPWRKSRRAACARSGRACPRPPRPPPVCPRLAETVPGYDFNGWAGLIAPKGTPRRVIERLQAALAKTLSAPEVRDGLAGQGADLFPGNTEEFRKFLAQDVANTERVMKAAQLQPE